MLDVAPIKSQAQAESSPDFELFRRNAYKITGLDLTSYKVPQMHRRLSVLLSKVHSVDRNSATSSPSTSRNFFATATASPIWSGACAA
jgi:CheR methyltransferase-like protein